MTCSNTYTIESVKRGSFGYMVYPKDPLLQIMILVFI